MHLDLDQLGMERKPITVGKVLLQQGLINEYQLMSALEEQQEEAEKLNWYLLGEIFVRWGLVTHEQLMSALSTQFEINEKTRFVEELHPSVRSFPKRALDLTGAIVGLTFTALIFPFVAAAIYLEDRGPIFFSQPRVGLRGKQFTIWKFRSMVADSDRRKLAVAGYSYAFFNVRKDARVTRVGDFLRKTSLDEFPQFWNVLKGEMSLVGTRPPTLDEVKHYSAEQWKRLLVKPGITGLWQASGKRHLKGFEDVLALDMEYQERWSLGYDIGLILKTFLAILFRPRAL